MVSWRRDGLKKKQIRHAILLGIWEFYSFANFLFSSTIWLALESPNLFFPLLVIACSCDTRQKSKNVLPRWFLRDHMMSSHLCYIYYAQS